MSKVKIQGNASGTGVLTITAPNTSTDRTITLPDTTGTLLDENSSVPAANLTGTIATARLGTGSAGSGNFLRGDGSWQTAGSTSASDLTSGTLSSARLPAGSLLKTTRVQYPAYASTTSTGYVNGGGSYSYTVTNAGCALKVTLMNLNVARHNSGVYWTYTRLLINGQSYTELTTGHYGRVNDYIPLDMSAYLTGLSLTAGQTLTFQQQLKTANSSYTCAINDGTGQPSLIIEEIKQ